MQALSPADKAAKTKGKDGMPVSTLKSRGCSKCGSQNHTGMGCYTVAKKRLVVKSAMKRVGPTTKEWLSVRTKWLRANLPNHMGYYECYICHKWVDYTEITLDHIKSRSRHPELTMELSNLAPCCSSCNQNKGSRGLEELNRGEQ